MIGFVYSIIMMILPPGCAKIDVVVLVDVSGSIKGYEDDIRLALVSFVDNLDISDGGIHAGIVAFSDGGSILCELTGNHDKFDDTFGRIKSDDGGTNMKSGFLWVQDELQKRGRPDALKVIIVISDGQTDYQQECLAMARMSELSNILVCSILIKNSTHDEEFMKQLGGHCYLETDYNHLYDELEKIDLCL